MAAPCGTPLDEMDQVVRAKLHWVRRKLVELEALGPPPEPRRMAAGELFPYLGCDYPLVLADRPDEPVALRTGSLEIDRALDGDARTAVAAWYTLRAHEYIDSAVARFAPLVGAEPVSVTVRDLGRRRWGICDRRTGAATFHRQLITQTPDLVDYVVVHELVHLHEPGHGPAFWRRVTAVLPDCRDRRRRLDAQGDKLVL